MTGQQLSIYISIASVAIAVLSLVLAFHSWREANRPLVSARISVVAGGNTATALNIVVENTGNRPARNIRLLGQTHTRRTHLEMT